MHRTDSEQSSRCQIDAKSASIAEEQKQKEKSHVYISVNFIYRNVAYLAKKKSLTETVLIPLYFGSASMSREQKQALFVSICASERKASQAIFG